MKYKNYDHLISTLKGIKDRDEQIKTLMEYFVDNVDYDYTIHGRIKSEGQIEKFREIDSRHDYSDPAQIEKALAEIKALGYKDDYIARLREHVGKEYTIPAKPERMCFGKLAPAEPEMTKVRPTALAAPMVGQIVTEKNGLITKGVCEHYAQFVNKVCGELDIPSVTVNSRNTKTGGLHSFNKIKGTDGVAKYYDPNYAIYIKNNYDYDGRQPHHTIENWICGVDDKGLKELQPVREIYKINGVDVKQEQEVEK